ncbi:MAG: hypothetical protein GY717_19840 [Rhodobacteraceae bacterium]|nr:hypothetical protein [Paracoccaceae bacterium]
MFGTLVLGLVAGAAAPYAERHVKRALESAAMAQTPLDAAELRALSLAVCLVLAAVLAWFLAEGGAVPLTVGAVMGVFGPRLIERFRGGE